MILIMTTVIMILLTILIQRRTVLWMIQGRRMIIQIQEMDLLMRRLLAPLLLKVTENWNGEFHSGAFADSIDYIKRNFRHDIAIPELAARAGTDRDSFSRGFRQAVGMSPKSYLIQTRINHARMLLLRTGMTAREIAREVGYHDEFFFYRLFRKRVGMTPTGYRELNNALR